MTTGPTPRYVKSIPVSARLTPFVHGMWEWDVPEAALRGAITGKLLPSVAPQFCFHYGSPRRQIARGLQTKVVTVQPTEPL